MLSTETSDALLLLVDLVSAIRGDAPEAYAKCIANASLHIEHDTTAAVLCSALPALLTEQEHDRVLAWGMGVRL